MKVSLQNNVNSTKTNLKANSKNIAFGAVSFNSLSRSERTAIRDDVLGILVNNSNLLSRISDPACQNARLNFEKVKDSTVKLSIVAGDQEVNLAKRKSQKNPLTLTFQLVGKKGEYSTKYAIPSNRKPLPENRMYEYDIRRDELSSKPMFKEIAKFVDKVENAKKEIVSKIYALSDNSLSKTLNENLKKNR